MYYVLYSKFKAFGASLPLQPAEGVADQKRVKVVEMYVCMYKIKTIQGHRKKCSATKVKKPYWSFQATIIHATFSQLFSTYSV